MAQRRANIPDDAMTKEQVEVLHRELSLLSPFHVKGKYKILLDECHFLKLATLRMKAVLLRVIWKYAAFE
jgi:hypothetical protein